MDKGLPQWAYIKKSNAANDPLPLVCGQMRSRTLFDGQRRVCFVRAPYFNPVF
jgi:hypothetical protein